MNKPMLKSKTKIKVKKKLVLPVVASLFFFAIMISISINNDLVSLMGNSVAGRYVCPNNYELNGNKCKLVIDSYRLGDINKDNLVNNKDLDIMNNYLSTNYLFSDRELLVVDVNRDGKFNISDINKIKFYIAGMSVLDIGSTVCPSNYKLENNICVKEEAAVVLDNKIDVGNAITYNDSTWYIIDNKDDYVTLLKTDYLGDAVNYDSVDNILNNYIVSIQNDLKDVEGSKIRLLEINDLMKLGFVDKTNTDYYESGNNEPYYIGINDTNYWIDDNYILTNYEDSNYAYKNDNDNTYAYIRPVINVYKSKLK